MAPRLYNNQITKIEGLEKLAALTTLDLGNNQITKIEGLEKLAALTNLQIYANKITKIEGLETLTALTTLYLPKQYIANEIANEYMQSYPKVKITLY